MFVWVFGGFQTKWTVSSLQRVSLAPSVLSTLRVFGSDPSCILGSLKTYHSSVLDQENDDPVQLILHVNGSTTTQWDVSSGPFQRLIGFRSQTFRSGKATESPSWSVRVLITPSEVFLIATRLQPIVVFTYRPLRLISTTSFYFCYRWEHSSHTRERRKRTKTKKRRKGKLMGIT